MIIHMKRITLIAHKDDEQKLLKALQTIGAVEIIDQNAEVQESETLSAMEQRVATCGDALSALRPYAEKKGMLSPRPETTASAIMNSLPKALCDSEKVEQLQRAITRTRSEIEKNDSVIASLHPWIDFPADMQTYQNAKTVKFFTGLLAAADEEKLSEYADILEYQTYNEAPMRAMVVAAPVAEAKNVQSVLKSLQWTDFAFPKLSGTPAEAIARLKNENAALEKEREKLAGELVAMAKYSDEIAGALDAATIERDRARAAIELLRTHATFHLEGWVREDQAEAVGKAVADVTDAYYLDIREPNEDEVPPSVVRNNSFNTPFEQVTNLYSRPDPNGIDATPYMAPFYVLLFGLMLSDSGYGIVLAIGCYLYGKLAKPTGMAGGFAKVLMWGGLSTIVWGVLVGTFFGMDFDVLFGTKDIFPILVDPMSDPIGMLILCFGLGLLHILFGVALKMKMSFARGDWQTAIFDNFSWVLIIFGLIMLALPATKTFGMVLAIIGAAMILFMKGREKKNPFSRTISGLGELYQVTSYLSDVLSYARLFALGIATGVIASVFNDLCKMLMGSPNIILKILGIVVACGLLVALHAFNIGINTLGAFVHCARLQYVEFYGKFYEAGGKTFTPLANNTRHVKLTGEN